MKIIHIKGAQCSGKTYTLTPFLDRPDVGYWDILEYYKETGCIVNDKMDWNVWEKVKPTIPNVLTAFLNDCDKKGLTAIVESGTNATINKVLMEYIDVTTLELQVPTTDTLKARATERQIDVQRVLEFRDMYLRRHASHTQFALTMDEARAAIKAQLDGLYVGIIGTAGRGADGVKMSKQLYTNMYRYANNYLDKLSLKPQDIQLVSGGAAWSDHVAVSLFLAHKADQLTLHLPSTFSLINGDNPPCFWCTSGNQTTADAANKYHREFSQKMGGNTLDGINQAIDAGANIAITKGFKPRDKKIAKESELLLAFTWGDGKEPKAKSGTAYTWNHCTAPVKHHVPLKEL